MRLVTSLRGSVSSRPGAAEDRRYSEGCSTLGPLNSIASLDVSLNGKILSAKILRGDAGCFDSHNSSLLPALSFKGY